MQDVFGEDPWAAFDAFMLRAFELVEWLAVLAVVIPFSSFLLVLLCAADAALWLESYE